MPGCIGGPPGIGKATLAYRIARFVLAHGDPSAPAVRRRALARGRSGAPGGAPGRRPGPSRPAGARAHRRTTAASLRTVITVDQVRRTVDVLRLDRGRRRLARVHRRQRRRIAVSAGRQRPPEDARGAAARARCSCWSATRPGACCRPSARAAAGSTCARSAPTRCREPPRLRAAAAPMRPRSRRRQRRPTAAWRARSPCWEARTQAARARDADARRAAGDRPEGAARARRRAGGHRRRCVRRLRRHGARLALRKAQGRAVGAPSPRPPGGGLGEGEPAAEDVAVYNLDRRPFVFSTFSALAEAARG